MNCLSSQKFTRFEKDYVGHIDEMRRHIGFSKVEYYKNLNNCNENNNDKTGLESLEIDEKVIHLDVDREAGIVDYFGSKTTVKQQKNMIRMMIRHFDGLNQDVVDQLRKIL